MRVLLVPVGLVALVALALVALNLGVGWAAWVAVGALFAWGFGAFLGFWPSADLSD